MSHTAQSPAAPAMRAATIAHGSGGSRVRAFGNGILFQLSTAQSGGSMVVGLATVPPGGRVPAHLQEREDELFLILDGHYRFWVDGQESDVVAGGIVYLPRGVAHSFQVVGDTPGRHWVVSTPGGFDRFYSQCAEVFAAGGPPDAARLNAINAEYGIRLV